MRNIRNQVNSQNKENSISNSAMDKKVIRKDTVPNPSHIPQTEKKPIISKINVIPNNISHRPLEVYQKKKFNLSFVNDIESQLTDRTYNNDTCKQMLFKEKEVNKQTELKANLKKTLPEDSPKFYAPKNALSRNFAKLSNQISQLNPTNHKFANKTCIDVICEKEEIKGANVKQNIIYQKKKSIMNLDQIEKKSHNESFINPNMDINNFIKEGGIDFKPSIENLKKTENITKFTLNSMKINSIINNKLPQNLQNIKTASSYGKNTTTQVPIESFKSNINENKLKSEASKISMLHRKQDIMDNNLLSKLDKLKPPISLLKRINNTSMKDQKNMLNLDFKGLREKLDMNKKISNFQLITNK